MGAVFFLAGSWSPVSALPVVTTTIANVGTPQQVIVSPNKPLVYSVGLNDNKVYVSSTSTNKVIDAISVGNLPCDLASTPDGKRLYVTNHASSTVSVIDTDPNNATTYNTVIATISGFDGPFGIVSSLDGSRMYVVNKLDDSILVINTATNTLVGLIPTDLYTAEPYWMALTPDGKRLYVTNSRADKVTVIDTTTNKFVTQISVGDYPFGVAVTPDGKSVYVANNGDDTISVIDSDPTSATYNTVVTTISAGDGPGMVAAAPNGSAMYVTLRNANKLSVIDTATKTEKGSVSVGLAPYGVAVTPASPATVGTPIYVADFSSNQLSVIQFSPDAPTAVQATAGNKKLDVSWTAPTYEGDDTITKYTATASPGNGTCESTTGTPVVTPSCTITGLTNGTAYTVTVVATSDIGDSAASTPSSSATPIGPPDKPTGVLLVAGDEELDVAWTAPTDTGGTAITKYRATTSPDGHWCESDTGSPVTPSCTITGLSNGTAYTVTVVATNAQGDSPPSAASSPATPATVPDAPTNVQATPGDEALAVQWTAPADNGGAAITKYRATTSPDGYWCESDTGSPVTPSCTIEGLTNGEAYTVTVVAVNFLGDGAVSAPSAPSTPVGPPDAPTAVQVTAGNEELAVEWTAPADTGGAAITKYTATASPGNKTCESSTGTPVTPSCTITGLTNGTEYTITVVATNDQGDSPDSASNTGIPVGPPKAPRDVRVTRGNKTLDVKWTAPVNDGGLPITAYTATTSPAGGTCITTGETSCTVEGLTNGTAYTVTVIATNDLGDGPASDASNSGTPATVPDAPTGVTASAGDAQITVQWTASAGDGGSAITGYTATTSPGARTCTTTGATNCTITGLTNGTAYTVTVVATNDVGDSLPSEAVGAVTPQSPTKQPQWPLAARGRPPVFIKTSGLTLVTGRNVRTNAGELLRTRVVGSSTAQGEVRYYRVIRGPQGKVSIRTYGIPGLKIVVVQYAPGTDSHYPYRKRSVYVDGVKKR